MNKNKINDTIKYLEKYGKMDVTDDGYTIVARSARAAYMICRFCGDFIKIETGGNRCDWEIDGGECHGCYENALRERRMDERKSILKN
jgi:hypothetical protein